MIKHLIFDFGQVLVHFEPKVMLAPFLSDPADAETVIPVLFDRLYWDRADLGTITEEEVVERSKERLPARLHKPAADAYAEWFYHLPEMEGMNDLLLWLKATYDIDLYVLSNISRRFAEHASEIPILRHFEGCVFSAVCGMVKPQPEIFSHLCGKFALDPSECLFVDDSPKNAAGSEAFGIRSYLFDGDTAKLKTYLSAILSPALLR